MAKHAIIFGMFSLQAMTREGSLTHPSEAQSKVFEETVGMYGGTAFSSELTKIEDSLTVTIDPRMEWPASVDFQRRTLNFREDLFASPQKLIPYLTFELTNYGSKELFKRAACLLNQKKIEPKCYIELVERIEYGTALKTHTIVKELLHLNRLDADAPTPYKEVAPTFELHLELQKKSGHTCMIKL